MVGTKVLTQPILFLIKKERIYSPTYSKNGELWLETKAINFPSQVIQKEDERFSY